MSDSPKRDKNLGQPADLDTSASQSGLSTPHSAVSLSPCKSAQDRPGKRGSAHLPDLSVSEATPNVLCSWCDFQEICPKGDAWEKAMSPAAKEDLPF